MTVVKKEKMKSTCVAILVLISAPFLTAQEENISFGKNLGQLKKEIATLPTNAYFSRQIQLFIQHQSLKNGLGLPPTARQIPSVYAYKDLAFFCKIEVKLEKVMKLPVKFRLGSVEQVDYLEGKRKDY